jgi:signal transduction histidine kinase
MSKKQGKRKIPRVKTRGTRRRRQTSIYLLLWAVFSVLSLFIVLLFVISQQVLLNRTYKTEAAQELNEKSTRIEHTILNPPPHFEGRRSELLQYLSNENDVQIFILDDTGKVLFPHGVGFDEDQTGAGIPLDFSDEISVLKDKLETQNSALYEGDGEFVYGSKISLYEDSQEYLYISKSLHLVQTVTETMRVRAVFTSIFVFVLAFAVSSAVSGWLTRPITEMGKKARQLARGDFDVDFYGDYSEEMVELADALNFARDELSKTDKMQKELLANVSHDFKTPLTMIKAYASMIIEISGDNPEKRNKHAQVIVDEADRLASLVGDLLDLSKIRSGINALKLSLVDMSAYTEEILGRFAYLQETQGYQIIADIQAGLNAYVDEVKIGQALYNLIGNAVNYTGEDKKVYVSLQQIAPDVFRFSVRDTGKGIKQEELSTIWDRYYRSAETHKRPVKGTGLGLSIVKTVLEKHRFVFGVESEYLKGSTFYVDFPLVSDETEKIQPNA